MMQTGAVMAKGRPRKPGNRYPSGDLKPARDRGSERRQAERAALVGKDNDATLADTPLGIMRARGFITLEMHDAGDRYAKLNRIKCGSPHGRASQPFREGHGHDNGDGEEKWRVEAEMRLAEADKLLGRHREAVRLACVHERLPYWLGAVIWMSAHGHPVPLADALVRDRDELIDGLKLLARKWYGRMAA